MSVILTGVDTPKNCDSCDLYVLDRDGFPYCAKTKQFIFKGKIHNKDCPLKSVDGLIEMLNDARYCGGGHYSENALSSGILSAIEIIKEYCEMEDK